MLWEQSCSQLSSNTSPKNSGFEQVHHDTTKMQVKVVSGDLKVFALCDSKEYPQPMISCKN